MAKFNYTKSEYLSLEKPYYEFGDNIDQWIEKFQEIKEQVPVGVPINIRIEEGGSWSSTMIELSAHWKRDMTPKERNEYDARVKRMEKERINREKEKQKRALQQEQLALEKEKQLYEKLRKKYGD